MSRANLILLQIRIGDLKDFFDHVVFAAGAEIVEIESRREAGEFSNVDDYENALYAPFMRQEIAARAIFYEINALIEKELNDCAEGAWLESEKHPGPKVISDLRDFDAKAIRSLRTVQDLPFREIPKLIKTKYDVDIRDLEGSEVLARLREIVNNFKHKDGVVDFRKTQDPVRNLFLFRRHRLDIEEAYEAIDAAYKFIRALWKATGREPRPQVPEKTDLLDTPDLDYLDEIVSQLTKRRE